ncbi:MAG: HlyD family efflux transporter periplasmic adaptor subunit [Chloroflexi bacterium]|nr:HlyD family efflux transporter periplasmic adaptor subunit [Chloroflexota bacterium]
MKKLTLILVLLAFLLSACDGTATPVPTSEPVKESSSNITAEGTLLPAPSVELGFVQGGVIAEVSAQSGQKVSAGQVIARLVGIESVQAELAAAQLEQTLAQQSLDALHRNALLTDAEAQQSLHDAQKAYETAEGRWDVGDKEKATDLELALEDYVQAEQDYRDAKEELDRFAYKDKDDSKRQKAQETFDKEKENLAGVHADLLKELPTSDALLDEKQIDLLQAIAALELARQQVDRLDQGLDRETLLAAETHLTAAQAHVQAAEAALELYELRAPFGGVLLRLDLKVGETASPGLPVAFLADISRWTIETKDLAEIDIARVRIGQSVIIKLDAFPGEEFHAQVSAIDPVGREYLGDMTYQVTVTLDEPDPRFLWNMTATVTIETP